MPAKQRTKTRYPGVHFIESTIGKGGEPERIFYITYRHKGKIIEEKAGRQHQDDMTPAKAAAMRTERMMGKQVSNRERRAIEKAAREAEKGRWTVSRLWQEYRSQKPDSKSMVVDSNRYELHIKDTFGGVEPKDLVQLDVDRLRLGLLKKKSPQTTKHVLALLKRIINFGVNRGLCLGPAFKIKLPEVDNEKTEDLSDDQLKALLAAIEKDKDVQAADIVRLALYTGMRRGELFKLEWRDVDFDRGFILIRDPKGGRTQPIPLNAKAREVLENHPRGKGPYVFPGKDGRQRTDIKKAVNRIKKAAGLPKDFRPLHGLRHTFASLLASSGEVDLYTLQRLLTHKSPTMTQRYAHLRDERLKRGSETVGTLIDRATEEKHGEQVAVRTKT